MMIHRSQTARDKLGSQKGKSPDLQLSLIHIYVPLQSITIMVQKEVADRMQVGPGTKDYGALSLAVQYYACLLYTSRCV